MTSERLREAAALMRSRVDGMKRECGLSPAADASEIPWFDVMDGLCDPDDEDAYRYMAALRPAVALAVADLLDLTAERYEQILSNFMPGTLAGVVAGENTLGYPAALAVANAYLATPDP